MKNINLSITRLKKLYIGFFIYVIFVGVSMASGVKPEDAKGNTININEKKSVNFIENKDMQEINAVEFFDDNKKLVKRLQSRHADKNELFGDKYSERLIKKTTKNYFIVTDVESNRNSDEAYEKTGYKRSEKNNIALYNDVGDVLFEKKGMDFRAIMVSDGGESVVCLKENPSLLEGVSNEAREGMRSKIIIFDKKGNVVFEGEGKDIYGENVVISKNGKWVCYKNVDKNGNYCINVVDALNNTKTSMIIKTINGINLGGYSRISDNGKLKYTKIVFDKGKGRNVLMGQYFNVKSEEFSQGE